MVRATDRERIAQRFREVREAAVDRRGESINQKLFADLLQQQGERMFGADLQHKYVASLVQRLETGSQEPTLQDVAIYATMDRAGRGKLWLGWGEVADSALRNRTQGPSVIKEPPEDIYDQPITPAKKPTRRRA